MRPEELESYTWPPATEVLAASVGLQASDVLRFDGNVPATPTRVARPQTIARALAGINEYDRGRYATLREAIAHHHDVSAEQIVLGAGSDELIVTLARAYASGGTIATVPAFTYSMYRYAAIMAGATIVDDPRDADLVFVCRPNNPTGEMPDVPETSGLLVIDEAYAQYAGETALDRVADGAVVLRTFSKAYGLAGARVGYAVCTEATARVLASRLPPLSVSALSAALALAALSAPLDVASQVAERDRLADEFARRGLAPLPSRANFLFIPTDRGEELVAGLLPYGVMLRAYPGGVRVSVRDQIDDDVLLEALDAYLAGVAPAGTTWWRRSRVTAESTVAIRVRLAGSGLVHVDTGLGIWDHFVSQLAFHGGLDLSLTAVGDLETGTHHTVEDLMRALGDAINDALGDRKGIARYGEATIPMDEAVARCVLDFSGRPVTQITIDPDEGMVAHALESFAQQAKLTLHVQASGTNAHHVGEGAFKAVGRALRQALAPTGGEIASTKGSL